jgi:hypothetical protein
MTSSPCASVPPGAQCLAMGAPVGRRALLGALAGFALLGSCSRSALYVSTVEAPPSPEDAATDAQASEDAALDAPMGSDTAVIDVQGSADGPPHAHDAAFDAPRDVAANPPTGCADGTREGFVDIVTYPDIAGCSGGWSIPGVMLENPGRAPACPTVTTHDTATPACRRQGGNSGPLPSGTGCDVADLCSAGWHVCTSAQDVATHSGSKGCAEATGPSSPPLFFATRQSSNGCGDCATGTRTASDCTGNGCTTGCAQTAALSNDVFGCGNIGDAAGLSGCDPLDRFSYNLGSALSGTNWSLTDDGSGLCEAYVVVHRGPDYGGALCCRD